MIDLYDCFGMNNEQWERLYRFKSDYHWNENWNRLAAVCLYRFLEEKMRFSDVSEDALRETLHQYYSAFGGWTPPVPPPPPPNKGVSSDGRRPASGRNIRRWARLIWPRT